MITLRSESSPRQPRHAQCSRSRQQVSSTEINVESRLHGSLVCRGVLPDSSELIETVRKSVDTLCNLDLHGLGCLLKVVASGIDLRDRLNRVREHARADVQVRVSGPCESWPLRVGDIVALNPHLRVCLVLASLDVLDQIRSPQLGVCEAQIVDVADLVGNGSVSKCVKVPGLAVESNVDSVATNGNGLVVQRLSDVAQEVNDPAKSVVDFLGW